MLFCKWFHSINFESCGTALWCNKSTQDQLLLNFSTMSGDLNNYWTFLLGLPPKSRWFESSFEKLCLAFYQSNNFIFFFFSCIMQSNAVVLSQNDLTTKLTVTEVEKGNWWQRDSYLLAAPTRSAWVLTVNEVSRNTYEPDAGTASSTITQWVLGW